MVGSEGLVRGIGTQPVVDGVDQERTGMPPRPGVGEMQEGRAVGAAGDGHGNRPETRIEERIEPGRELRRRDRLCGRLREAVGTQPVHCSFWLSWSSRRLMLVAASGNSFCSRPKVVQASDFWPSWPSAMPSFSRLSAALGLFGYFW